MILLNQQDIGPDTIAMSKIIALKTYKEASQQLKLIK